MNSYIWHSGCPNYQFTAFVFFIFWLVEEGEVWFESDSTWLINYKKRIRYCQFFLQAQLSIIFTTIKLIYTLVYISIFEQFFFSVAWNMNLSQTVSNNIIGNMLFWGNLYWKRYKMWTCCKTWSGVWGLFWSGVWSHFWSRFWSHFWSWFWSPFWSRFYIQYCPYYIHFLVFLTIQNRHKKGVMNQK